MKILHISPSYYPAFKFGGPIQAVYLLNKELVKQGLHVDVLTTDAGLNDDQKGMILHQARNNKDGWVDPSLIDKSTKAVSSGVRVKYINYWGYEHYNFSIPFVSEVKKIIKNYDLVHITAVWNFPVLVSAYYCIKFKIPYIISPRGVLHQAAIGSKSTLIKKIYYKLLAKKYLQKAASIDYTSLIEKEQSELILKHPNSTVTPNGIELTEINNSRNNALINKLKLSDVPKYILILGRINKIKGFDLLIPAYKEVLSRYNDLTLIIAGDDSVPYASNIKKVILDLNMSDRVIFTGEVKGNDKWSLYKNAYMFVLPSYSENFGMAIIEAMACGCPVIISDKVGISKEIKENNAGVIVQTNVNSIAEGITALLNDSELRNKITSNGKTMVEKYYDIGKVSEQMINKYKRILNIQ